MLSAMRIVTVQRGYDPRDFSLLVSGGTAAVHAARMAQELRIPRVICPLSPGTFSAYGLITADARNDVYRSYVSLTTHADPVIMQRIYDELKEEARGEIVKLGFQTEEVHLHYKIDMRYTGQAHEVVLDIPAEMLQRKMDGDGVRELEALFHERHKALFGHSSPDGAVEFITLSVTAIGPIEKAEMYEIEEGTEDAGHAQKGMRKVFFEDFRGYANCRTYDRYALKTNNVIRGPGVVEQMDTTIVIPPRQTARVDRFGNIIMEIVP
jgi:N-methylhydantoinase A